MHSPYASKKRSTFDIFSSFSGCQCVYFYVCVCSVALCPCAVVCMALTVQEHRGYTPDHSVLFPLVLPRESVGYKGWKGFRLRS